MPQIKERAIVLCSDLQEFLSVIRKITDGWEGTSVFLLCDENTYKYCYPFIAPLNQPDKQVAVFVMPSGEAEKTSETLFRVLDWLSEHKASRKSLLMNLGGGVVSDLGGFAASIYKRGISYINLPTTLLAMIDAAIGGKTGINHHHIKNQIGSFHLPQAVLIWPGFLETLPATEWLSGKGEMMKYALLGAGFTLQDIPKTNDTANFGNLISLCASFKYRITTLDPNEKKIRMILNFGHTIGHALESEALRSGVPLSHGEAVAAGILAELNILLQKKLIPSSLSDDSARVYRIHFKPTPIQQIIENDVTEWLHHDKKIKNGKMYIPAIPFKDGDFFRVEVSLEQLQSGLEFLKRIFAD